MIIELKLLLGVALLCPALPLVQSAAYARQIGIAGLAGDRSTVALPQGFAGRALRAHRNLVENLVPFAAVVLVARAMDVSDGITVLAAVVFSTARLAHAVSYLAGIPIVRSMAWNAGLAATVVYAAHLLTL